MQAVAPVPNLYAPDLAGTMSSRGGHGVLERRMDAPRRRQQRVAGRGWLHFAASALQQPHTEHTLQLAQLLAGCRLRQVQLTGRRRDAACLDNREKRPELPQGRLEHKRKLS